LFVVGLVNFDVRIYFLFLLCTGLSFWSCDNSTNQNNELDNRQFNYLLEDINSSSQSYGNEIGPSYYEGQITLNYFGHFN